MKFLIYGLVVLAATVYGMHYLYIYIFKYFYFAVKIFYLINKLSAMCEKYLKIKCIKSNNLTAKL
jgi:hypothetical protein